jgi:hypothetical protein
VEIRILKRLFTPEEARPALSLNAIPEPVHIIHRRVRLQMSREQLSEALERMAAKGIIQGAAGRRGARYGKAPLVVGMYEYQVNRLTPELERDVRAYMAEGFGEAVLTLPTPQMRTTPVNKSIRVEHAVASYDDLRRFVEASPGPFAALDCVCRQGRALTGEPCWRYPATSAVLRHHKKSYRPSGSSVCCPPSPNAQSRPGTRTPAARRICRPSASIPPACCGTGWARTRAA